MSQLLTLLAALFRPARVRVTIRLDHSGVGAHLIWTIANGRAQTVTIAKLVFRGAHGSWATVTLDPPRTIAPQGELILPVDVDWNLLGALEIAAVDTHGRAHEPPHRQLVQVQERLRQAIDRRRSAPRSARAFLAGAADLAFGVMLLGLGFFMLMWVIATG
ncbi:MAG TPA: hypothetical protein VFA27_11100 [Vicinamibacterales bacterium]|nr:hypothetical protein [Vicinamibacterales bacterium]